MYGTDTSQLGALAATGLAIGATEQVLAGAVVAIAAGAAITVARVIRARRQRNQGA